MIKSKEIGYKSLTSQVYLVYYGLWRFIYNHELAPELTSVKIE